MYLNAYSLVHQRNLFFEQFIFFKVLGLSPWTLNFSAKASRGRNTKFTVWRFSHITTYTFRQQKMIKIFNKMNNIDQTLQRYAFHSSENGNVIISLIFIFNILICAVLVTLGLHNAVLDMIQKRFKFLNSSIMKLGNIEEDSKLSPAFSLQRLAAQRRPALHDVVNIRHTYHKLCEICEDVSEFYGFTILAGMAHNGILVTLIVSYFLLVFFMGMIKLDLISCFTYGVIVVWFAFQTTVLTSYVTRTIIQIEKTANVINKLIRQCAMDEKVEKELINFRCELAFQKVKFTAWGIFSLDRSFLAS
ncbi:GSCOCT00014143001.2-RA-CDS, partial [Cotesia congregata]